MRSKHSNERVPLICKVRKNWREILYYFCRFERTSVVNLAKGFGGPNLNLTEHSTAINLLYQNHFDLKFYPRSLKLEDPPKVTRDANCTLYKGIIKSQNHLSREYKSIAS